MVNPEREPLKDRVEVDETYLGGPEAGLKGGRQLLDKALVVGAVEFGGGPPAGCSSTSSRMRPALKAPPDGPDGTPGGTIARSTSANERPSKFLLLRRGSRVTKTVTTGRDSPASPGVTASHRVTANPSILLTRHHGTARHKQLPKLDVAGSIPVARSNVHRGLRRRP